MAVTLSLFAGVAAQFLDNSGNVLTGGLIYSYAAGTTTPLATYTSSLGTSTHPNPIILDASGRVPGGEIWLTTGYGYKFVTKDSNNVLIGTYDNIPSSAQPPIINDASSISYEQGAFTVAGNFIVGGTYLITSLGTTNFTSIGATSNTVGIYFIATGVGSGTGTAQFSRTVQAKLQETISVKDFGAVGDGTTDNTAIIQKAINATAPYGTLIVNPGVYMVQGLSLNYPITIIGYEATLKLIPNTAVFPALALPIIQVFSNDIEIIGLTFDGNRFLQTGGHSDWVVFHRRSCAITGYDVKYTNFTLKSCTFTEFYNAAIVIVADNTRIIDCNINNTNTGTYMCFVNEVSSLPNYPAYPNIITDGVFISKCFIKNIGTKTNAFDTREYGNDIPVVTGDGMLLRAKNTIISECHIYNVDRDSIKFENPDGNHVISNNICNNSYDGNTPFGAFQFNDASAAKTPSITDPSNIVITNNVIKRPSGFGGIGGSHYGIIFSNNVITCNSGNTNGGIILAGVNQCLILNNSIVANNTSNPGIKISTAYGNLSDITIANNFIKSSGIGMQFAGNSTGSYVNVNILDNIFSSLNAQSTDADPLVFTNFYVKGNKADTINFISSGSARPNLTNINLVGNFITNPPLGLVASGSCVDNLISTKAGSSTEVIGGFLDNQVTGTHFRSGLSGQTTIFTDGATTPDVKGKTFFTASNSGATSITNFLNPYSGQEIFIYFTNGNTTIVNSSTIRLAGAVNFVSSVYDILTLIYVDSIGWVEKSRSIN